MRHLITIAISAVFLASVVVASPAPELVEFFSFEQDFEGWMPESILTSGSTASITRSQDRSIDGQSSVKLDVHATRELPTAAGWIQRAFALVPNETYQLQLRYFLATSDGGLILGGTTNLVGATNSPPSTLSDALTLSHELVRSDKSPRYRWLRKEYEFTARTDDAGTISVIIGVLAAGI